MWCAIERGFPESRLFLPNSRFKGAAKVVAAPRRRSTVSEGASEILPRGIYSFNFQGERNGGLRFVTAGHKSGRNAL